MTTGEGAPGTVTVADGGPGVPARDLDKIFEPFYRIDTNRPGAGIGLAITKRVLQQLGGTLTAVNRHGRWSANYDALSAFQENTVGSGDVTRTIRKP